jgi:hypothetical protein
MVQKISRKKFCEQHHAPYIKPIRGGITRGVTGGGVQGEGWYRVIIRLFKLLL